MEIKEYLSKIGISQKGNYSKDAYVIDLLDSTEYSKVFSKLDNCDDLEISEDNQVLTEQGSSHWFESKSQPYILNLIADWDGDIYQLVVNNIEE